MQTESPLFMSNVFRDAIRDLKKTFGQNAVTPLLTVIPSYPGAMWSFGFCSETQNPHNPSRAGRIPKNLNFYNADVHKACLALPSFVRELLAQ